MVNNHTETLRVAVKEFLQSTSCNEYVADVIVFIDNYSTKLVIRLVMPYYIHDIQVPFYIRDDYDAILSAISKDVEQLEKIRYKAYSAVADVAIEEMLS